MFVVITGASRGIGMELAYIYAKHKYNLFLTCKKNIIELYRLKNELEEKFGIVVIIKKGHIENGDLEKINDIYLLINNASIAEYNLFCDTTIDRYYEIIDANIIDCLLATREVLPKLQKNKMGIILNISSIWGIVGSSMESVYSLTKAGIIGFTKSLAKENEFTGVSIFSIALGMVDTDMNNNLSNEDKKNIIEKLDNKKMMTKEFVANKIFEIILNNSYKNGDVIEINNGLK